MSIQNLVQLLLDFVERASVIAQTIRKDENLFKLLIEEKTGSQKNERFTQDFKTLADVLIQQLLCHQVEKQFPQLAGRVYGEESAVFSNSAGETVTVAVLDEESDTALLLSKVLDGNTAAAEALAHQLHRTDLTSPLTADPGLPSVPLDQLAIWIDPIDSTAEYIEGKSQTEQLEQQTASEAQDSPGTSNHPEGRSSAACVVASGLPCVTVLVGVFRVADGAPVAGVISQPFAASSRDSTSTAAQHRSAAYWGVMGGGTSLGPQLGPLPPLSRVCVSGSEQSSVLAALAEASVTAAAASGAGYKCLMVMRRQVEAYLCSKGSTYMWDTCGPHAVLLAMGGGIVPYSSLHHFAAADPPPHLVALARVLAGH